MPVLPGDLFRDAETEAAQTTAIRPAVPIPDPATDPAATAAYKPDFLQSVSDQSPPSGPPRLSRPEPEVPALPEDLFRGPAASPPAAAAAAESGSFGFRQFGAPETAAIPLVQAAPDPGWSGPAGPGSPESDLLPSELPSAAPGPARDRTGLILLVILALLVAAAVIGGLLWWNAPSPTQPGAVRPATSRATAPTTGASTAPSASPATSAPASSVSPPASPGAFPPAGAKACTGAVAVNSTTSCPFAANVAAALPPIAEGAQVKVTASSPTTGQTYEMTCRRSGYVTCTGGDSAVVYIKVAP